MTDQTRRLARVTPELIRLASATAETLAQPLHRDVEANLGPVAKTIDNCLRRIRDGNVDILDAVTLNSFGQSRSCEPHESHSGIIDLGPPGDTVDRHPPPVNRAIPRLINLPHRNAPRPEVLSDSLS